jgi:predicted ATP-grasp superfamily ATP-dependent carboligase
MDHGLGSRYCSKVEVCPDLYQSGVALRDHLVALGSRYHGPKVLIPASDDCASFVAEHHDALSAQFRVLGPSWSVMNNLANKKLQYEAAWKLGISTPETYFPERREELERLLPTLSNYPYIIKPLVAQKWRLSKVQQVTQGRKAIRANDAQSLMESYELVSSIDRDVMVQEVIGGRDDRLLTYIAYLNEQSEPLGFCTRKKLRQSPIDFGYCTMTVSCRDRVVEELSLKLLQALEFHGICGVEWKVDPKTGEYRLIEVNPRAMNTLGIARASGVDIPVIAVTDKLGHPVSDPPRMGREGVMWVSATRDLSPARTLHRRGELRILDWVGSVARADVHAVFDLHDLGPFVLFFADSVRGIARGRFKKLLEPFRRREEERP